MKKGDLENYFTYHPPTAKQTLDYVLLREEGKIMSVLINDACPESREKSTAIVKLRECIMWANAAIVCNSGSEEPESVLNPTL